MILQEFIFEKSKLWFLEVWNKKEKKIRGSHFLERSIWNPLVFLFCLRSASKPYILEAIESWAFFDPKSCNMTSLKCHFLENFSTEFAEILSECAKLMLYKASQVSRWYLYFFKLLREFARGGGRYTPPANDGLNRALMGLWNFHHLMWGEVDETPPPLKLSS